MAQRIVVELLDDINGKSADESITFGLNGATYEIDLSAQNADKLRKNFAPFVAKARKAVIAKAGRSTRGASTRPPSSRGRSMEIRAWARQHGIAVHDRGRIPAQVVDAYEVNDPSRVKAQATKTVPQTTFRAVSNP